MSNIIVCWWLDLNHGPLASEGTAIPTEPHHHCHHLLKLYLLTISVPTSVTRLGDFLVLLGYKNSNKSSPNVLVNFWAILNNTSLMLKMIYFLPNIWKNWATFYFIIWSHWFQLFHVTSSIVSVARKLS